MAVLFLLMLFARLTATARQDEQALMQLANKAYNEGLYDSALVVYSQIVATGMESAALYYNMGNAYYKNNDLPSAILFYEKAKKLAPNDEDIAYNLGIANSMIVDKIEKVPVLFYKHWWNYFYNLFDANTWTVVSLVCWIVLLFFIGVFVLSKSRASRKLSFYLALLFLLLSIGTFGLASQKYYFSKEHKEAIIFTPTITVKSSPTLNSVDLFVIHEGTKVKVLDKVQGWLKIKIPDGSVGWVPVDALRTI